MKRPSQKQKRIVASLGRCFCVVKVISKVATQTEATNDHGKWKVRVVCKCGLCRLSFDEREVLKHVLAHHEPIAEKVAQIESLAAMMGGDLVNHYRACEQVMGWRPVTSTATEFFRRQVSKC